MTRSIHSTTRRTALATAALALASSAFWAAGTAHAAYPDKPITLVVPTAGLRRVGVQHPTGRIQVEVKLSEVDGQFKLVQAALVRTARKILEGTLFVPESAPAH